MDITFERQSNERDTRQKYRKAFFAVFAPGYSLSLFFILLCALLGYYIQQLRHICFPGAAVMLVLLLLSWPRYWRYVRDAFQKSGMFDMPATIHITDHFIEITRGENHSIQEYKIYTHYLDLKDVIVLLYKRSILGILDRSVFPDDGAEWMKCLEANGVRHIQFWDFKRWRLVLLLLLLAVLMMLAIMLPTKANEANGKWCMEKANITSCIARLKMTGLALNIYAYDNNAFFPPTLETLRKQYYLEEPDTIRCPESRQEYRYVPYSNFVNETAVLQPIVIEHLGNHWKRRGLFGKEISLTSVLFADGHVVTMENLPDYMDIYDQYARHLSPEDAEMLKKSCEAWDRER